MVTRYRPARDILWVDAADLCDQQLPPGVAADDPVVWVLSLVDVVPVRLEDMAWAIWVAAVDGGTLDDIRARVRSLAEVPPELIRSVDVFVEELVDRGLLEVESPDGTPV